MLSQTPRSPIIAMVASSQRWPCSMPLRPLHLVVRETEFCGLRLAGDFRRRMRENGRNSVRRPRIASLMSWEFPRLCRGGSSSLTFQTVAAERG